MSVVKILFCGNSYCISRYGYPNLLGLIIFQMESGF
jgi:hypothetical protein